MQVVRVVYSTWKFTSADLYHDFLALTSGSSSSIPCRYSTYISATLAILVSCCKATFLPSALPSCIIESNQGNSPLQVGVQSIVVDFLTASFFLRDCLVATSFFLRGATF